LRPSAARLAGKAAVLARPRLRPRPTVVNSASSVEVSAALARNIRRGRPSRPAGGVARGEGRHQSGWGVLHSGVLRNRVTQAQGQGGWLRRRQGQVEGGRAGEHWRRLLERAACIFLGTCQIRCWDRGRRCCLGWLAEVRDDGGGDDQRGGRVHTAAELLWHLHNTPEGGRGGGGPASRPTELRSVVRGATLGAAAAGVVSVDEHPLTDGGAVTEVDESR